MGETVILQAGAEALSIRDQFWCKQRSSLKLPSVLANCNMLSMHGIQELFHAFVRDMLVSMQRQSR